MIGRPLDALGAVPPALWLSISPQAFLEPLLERAAAGVRAGADAASDGRVTVDTALHLTSLAAEPEDPQVAKLRATLDRRIGEAQLRELMLAVDAEVRYRWLKLGREPRLLHKLVMVCAGILAHGTALSAAENTWFLLGKLTAKTRGPHIPGVLRVCEGGGFRD